MTTQTERVLDYLQNHKSITQKEALNSLGIWRLASRISDLKKQGHNITKEMVTVKNRWKEKCSVASYSLVK